MNFIRRISLRHFVRTSSFFIFIAYIRNPAIIVIIIIILFFVIIINTIIINLTCYRIGKPGKTMCKKTELMAIVKCKHNNAKVVK